MAICALGAETDLLTHGVNQKGRTYLNKPTAKSFKFIKYVWPFSAHQTLKGQQTWKFLFCACFFLSYWSAPTKFSLKSRVTKFRKFCILTFM